MKKDPRIGVVMDLLGQVLVPRGFKRVGSGFRKSVDALVRAVEIQRHRYPEPGCVEFFVNFTVVPKEYAGPGLLAPMATPEGFFGITQRIEKLRNSEFVESSFVARSAEEANAIALRLARFIDRNVDSAFDDVIALVQSGNTPFRF